MKARILNLRQHLGSLLQLGIPQGAFVFGLYLWFGGFGLAQGQPTTTTNAPLDALREALAKQQSAWGRPQVGQFSRHEPDAQALAVANRIREVARPLLAKRGVTRMPVTSTSTNQVAMALEEFRSRASADAVVHWRQPGGTVVQMRGRVLEPAATLAPAPGASGSREEWTAQRFLGANRKLLRLEEPDAELKLESSSRDELGRAHLKYSQRYQGVPVWPAGLAVHLDRAGNVTCCDGAYVATPALSSVVPALSVGEGEVLAKQSVPSGYRAKAESPLLVVYAPLDRAPRLAWRFEVSVGMARSWWVLVDAQDGRVLDRLSRCAEDGKATGAGVDLGNQSRALNLWLASGKYYLLDASKPMFVSSYNPMSDPHGALIVYDARNVDVDYLETVYMVESTSATSSWPREGVSAAFNFSETYDYFLQRHNRNSIDGQGMNILAVVKVGFDNAFWNGSLGMMFFGNARPYPHALDVVAHELTHGVTEHTAGLIYEFQSGAMNEAFSDIFGEMVESRTRGATDWKTGTDLGFIIRDAKNPGSLIIGGLNKPYPSKMSEYLDLPADADHGGVHLNSTIITHAFYLAAEGLAGAIGQQDAEKVFYRCLTQHLQNQSRFVDARLGCIASAEELFGSTAPQVAKITEAFDEVEVYSAPAPPPPPPLPPVDAPDSTLLISKLSWTDSYFTLGRREDALRDPFDGMAIVTRVKNARPTVTGDGAIAMYVDDWSDIGLVLTDDPSSADWIDTGGSVHSIALSPDARFFAFVLLDAFGDPDNRIFVGDLESETNHTYTLVAPISDGGVVDNVLYADSMVFTADSKTLLYDAAVDIRFGTGSTVERWSIFRIDLASGTTSVVAPPLREASFGNPNVGRLSNRYLTFDAFDADTGIAQVFVMDLYSGEVATVGYVGDGLGFPCFSGDERSVIFAQEDYYASATGYSLIQQALGPTRLTAVGLQQVWLPDATIGVIYRRGGYAGTNALPTVTITAPADQTEFISPAAFTITAQASDPDGSVSKVEFYQGANKMGESPARPYSFTWYNVAEGEYRLFARAFDDLGAAADSQVVTVRVKPVALRLGLMKSDTEVIVTVAGAQGRTCELLTSESIESTDWPVAKTFDVTNAVQSVTLPAPASPRSFWRVRAR